jgi:N6-adenosine-specific RNA methylase IME4
MCLLATKGRPKRINKDVAQLVVAPRGRHSEKPLLHGEIERLCEGPYIELFARKKTRDHWDFWGNEV